MTLRLDPSIKAPFGEKQLTPDEARGLLSQMLDVDPRVMTDTDPLNPAPGAGIVSQNMSRIQKIGRFVDNAVWDWVPGVSGSSSTMKDPELIALIDRMVALLPPEALYHSTMVQIDPTQLLGAVLNEPGLKAGQVKRTRELLAAQEKIQAAAVTAINAQQGVTDPAKQQERIDKYLAERAKAPTLKVSPNAALRLSTLGAPQAPGTSTTPGATTTAAGATNGYTKFVDAAALADGTGTGSGGEAAMTSADVAELFRVGASGDASLIAQMVGAEKDAATGGTPIEPGVGVAYDDPGTRSMFGRFSDRFDVPASARPAPGGKVYTYSEISQLLHTMSRDQVKAVQDKMRVAGYFIATGNPNGPLYEGDPTDDATVTAWQRLITDSARAGKSMTAILSAKATDAQRQGILDAEGYRLNADGQRLDKAGRIVNADGHVVDAMGNLLDRNGNMVDAQGRRINEFGQLLGPNGQPQSDITLTDASTIRVKADDLAKSTLGRKLRADEQAQLVTFIHNLETTTAQRFQAAGSQTGEDVDVNAQIQEQLRAQHPAESAGHDVAGAYDMFTTLLGGPSRRG